MSRIRPRGSGDVESREERAYGRGVDVHLDADIKVSPSFRVAVWRDVATLPIVVRGILGELDLVPRGTTHKSCFLLYDNHTFLIVLF